MEFRHYLKEGSKRKTAALILTNKDKFLLGKASNIGKWDLPKGGVHSGEAIIDGCIREVEEETGLTPLRKDLNPLGRVKYSKSKDLYPFVWFKDNLPPISSLKCVSTFEDTDGSIKPELDGFAYTDWTNFEHFNKDGCRIYGNLIEALKKIKNILEIV